MSDFLVFSKYPNGYSVGTHAPDTKELIKLPDHNGVKDEYANTIENIAIPERHLGEVVFQLGYRCFKDLYKLKSVYIPKTILSFNGDTFFNCISLENVIFAPDSRVTDISYIVFTNTSIKTIVLPPSLIKSGKRVFSLMKNLKEIYLQSFFGCFDSTLFEGISTANIKIYVPSNYPDNNFCGISVSKSLPPFKKYYKTKIICQHASNGFLIMQLILLSVR